MYDKDELNKMILEKIDKEIEETILYGENRGKLETEETPTGILPTVTTNITEGEEADKIE